jgi:transposase
MFVRQKKNPSGVISIQVIDKSTGTYKMLKSIGSSSNIDEVEQLCRKGQEWIRSYGGQLDILSLLEKEHHLSQEMEETARVLDNIDNILINGTQIILNHVFHCVGFDKINDDILKQLVISRLCQPSSKSGTVDYLKSHFDEDINLSKIYRYLDKLYNREQEKIQQISVEHTRKILGGRIGLVFYDVTTLYFESDYGDELRATGFSKDGKHSQPQVVLGLLVSAGGYPLSYSLFNGSQYEGHTMIPIVEDFVNRFDLEDFVVVADSGLMNKTNVELLESGGYKYIIGARIKNENDTIKSWVLSLEKQDNRFYEYVKANGSRLIVGYSSCRAKKDAYNREKGVKRLEKAYRSGSITKESINKRGYNKFLEIKDTVKVSINQKKIKEDVQWDGLKGYITNTTLPAEQVYEQYQGLWVVERAYRVTKGTLEMRPIFHFTSRRIEAHVCICFVAYKVYKELERILKTNGINLSVDKVLAIAKTITTINVKMPNSGSTYTKTMLVTTRHKLIARLFDDDFWNRVSQ